MASTKALIDMEAANARKLPVIMEDPGSVTCDYSPSGHGMVAMIRESGLRRYEIPKSTRRPNWRLDTRC